MAKIYKLYNGAAPTTAVLAKVATGTAIKTMLQAKLKAGVLGRVVEWGISFDAAALGVPVQCELIETATVFATVTAHVAAGIHKFSDPNLPDPTTTYFDVGTAATGYTGSAEGSITASRLADHRNVLPTNEFSYQWPLDREFVIDTGTSMRIRVDAAADVGCICWMAVEVQ
jgi:hypothetical protein